MPDEVVRCANQLMKGVPRELAKHGVRVSDNPGGVGFANNDLLLQQKELIACGLNGAMLAHDLTDHRVLAYIFGRNPARAPKDRVVNIEDKKPRAD